MGSIITQLFFYTLAFVILAGLAFEYLALSVGIIMVLLLLIILGTGFGVNANKYYMNKEAIKHMDKELLGILTNAAKRTTK